MPDRAEHDHAHLPITVIMNAGSGKDDKRGAREQIERTLAASGRQFRILEAAPHELSSRARGAVEQARREPQILVAAGGDGTINAVAAQLVDTSVPLGVIPLGTFNYFARELGIPLDAAAAASALLDGRAGRRHVGKVNGHVFLINSSFGLYRQLQEEREQRKRRLGRNKVIDVFSALMSLSRHHRTYDVQLELDEHPLRLRTLMMFFGVNRLQLEKLGLPAAECLDRARLAVLVLRPVSRLELLGYALRGALRRLGDAQNLRSFCAAQVEVSWHGARRMKVALDGESIECSLPLRFEIAREALVVIEPRNPEPRQ